MLHTTIPEGAIFHAPERRRRRIIFATALRTGVETAVTELTAILARTTLPPPVHDSRCRDCSLRRLCLPELPARTADVFAPAPEVACASF